MLVLGYQSLFSTLLVRIFPIQVNLKSSRWSSCRLVILDLSERSGNFLCIGVGLFRLRRFPLRRLSVFEYLGSFNLEERLLAGLEQGCAVV